MNFCEIPNFDGYYITDDGKIWSELSHRWKKQRLHQGYVQVTLCKEGKLYPVKTCILVLEAFIGPRPKDMECCHNNGNSQDNRLENLRWDTHSSNCRDSIIHKTSRLCKQFGEDNTNCNLTTHTVQRIRTVANLGLCNNQRKLAKMFNTTRANIGRILRRETWKQVTCV